MIKTKRTNVGRDGFEEAFAAIQVAVDDVLVDISVLVLLFLTAVAQFVLQLCLPLHKHNALRHLTEKEYPKRFVEGDLWYHKRCDLLIELIINETTNCTPSVGPQVPLILSRLSLGVDSSTLAHPSCPCAVYAWPYRQCSHAAC